MFHFLQRVDNPIADPHASGGSTAGEPEPLPSLKSEFLGVSGILGKKYKDQHYEQSLEHFDIYSIQNRIRNRFLMTPRK